MYYTTVYYNKGKFPTSFRFAYLGVFTFFVGTIYSMIIYPRQYDPFKYFLSELGTKPPAAFWFNLTVMTTAMLLIPMFVGINRYLKGYLKGTSHKFLKSGSILGVASMVSLFLVGLVPAVPETRTQHIFFAISFFFLISTSIILLNIAIITSDHSKIPNRENLDLLGFSFLPLVILMWDWSQWYAKIMQKVLVSSMLFFLLYFVNKVYKLPMDREFYYHKEKIGKEKAYSLDEAVIRYRIMF